MSRACWSSPKGPTAHNRSVPGVLKHALDHASRPHDESAWAGKPAGVLGVSIGATGTAVARQHLHTTLPYLAMPVLGQREAFLQAKEVLFDGDDNIGEKSRDFVQGWMNAYVAWVEVRTRKHAG